MSAMFERITSLDQLKKKGGSRVVMVDGAEVIDADGFQERMGIGRTSFHKWRKEGRLVQGKHYIRIRSRVWVFWSKQLLIELSDPPTQANKKVGVIKMRSPAPEKRRNIAVDLSV